MTKDKNVSELEDRIYLVTCQAIRSNHPEREKLMDQAGKLCQGYREFTGEFFNITEYLKSRDTNQLQGGSQ